MKKILVYIVLPVIVIVLGYLLYKNIQAPVIFQGDVKKRSVLAIERLKDIRTLQIAYKTSYGKYASSMDSLIDFYQNGKIVVIKQIGSLDDSLAVAQKKIVRDSIKINVRDTLLKRANFVVDSLRYIPYSGGSLVEMKSVVSKVSGVDVPLFEAKMPYLELLKGLDHQSIINLNFEKESVDLYPGVKVGSIDTPNNNAGNWE